MNRNLLLAALLAVSSLGLQAGQLPCQKPGTERWGIKTSLPESPRKVTMSLTDALNLPRLTNVKKNDPRYADKRITDQQVKEDQMVTVKGWLYLVAFEGDDCDFHIQISPEAPTAGAKPANSMIVEVPSGEYAATIKDQVEAVRQMVVTKLLNGVDPNLNSTHLMTHPVFVQVTGALFYDDAHTYSADGTTGRGKKGMPSRTLWELHPITSIVILPKPAN